MFDLYTSPEMQSIRQAPPSLSVSLSDRPLESRISAKAFRNGVHLVESIPSLTTNHQEVDRQAVAPDEPAGWIHAQGVGCPAVVEIHRRDEAQNRYSIP